MMLRLRSLFGGRDASKRKNNQPATSRQGRVLSDRQRAESPSAGLKPAPNISNFNTTRSSKAKKISHQALRLNSDLEAQSRLRARSTKRVQSNVETTEGPRVKRQEPVTCVICCLDSNEETIPHLRKDRLTSKCTHERSICVRCAQRHIHEIVQKGLPNGIRCIESGCRKVLSHADIKRAATSEDFTRYDKLLLRQTLDSHPEFRWCSKPTCGSGQMHPDKENRPIIRCHACSSKTCFTHRTPWHTNRTCKQYDEDAKRSDEVALLQSLERSGLKRCPKCNHGVEKNGGCDHMTCKRAAGGCGAEFCWLCLADYNGPSGIRAAGNKAHRSTCRYYR